MNQINSLHADDEKQTAASVTLFPWGEADAPTAATVTMPYVIERLRKIKEMSETYRATAIPDIALDDNVIVGRSLAFRRISAKRLSSPHLSFVDCDLRASRLSLPDHVHRVDLIRCSLLSANIRVNNVESGNVVGSDARWSIWNTSKVARFDFSSSKLRGAELKGVDFTGCNLSDSTLLGVDARGADFRDANLTNCDCSGSNLEGAKFAGATFKNTNFSFCKLEGAKFHPVEFKEGNFFRVRWTGGEIPLGWPEDWPQAAPREGLWKVWWKYARIRHLRRNPVLRYAALLLGPLVNGPFSPATLDFPSVLAVK